MTGSIARPLTLGALCAALAGACAAHRPPPPPPPATPAPPPEPTAEERLDEAARLLSDGLDLPRVQALLAAVPPGLPRRELLAGQLAELAGDDAGAEAAYARYLAQADDDEVRLRRALLLERLGRGDEALADLARLRPAQPPPPPARRPERKLRPLK